MATAKAIGEYLTYLAQSGDEPDPLTNLRLQKLLYYVQGWSLAMRGKPAFPDRIEAWAHGPVVPDVYHELKQFGYGPFVLTSDTGAVEEEIGLDAEDRAFIGEVWETYQCYSAIKLREMTHREDPWVEARMGFLPGQRCNTEITREALLTYFKKLAAAS